MAGNRVLMVLGSTNTLVALQTSLDDTVSRVCKKTVGLKNGRVMDGKVFQQFLNSLLVDLEVKEKGGAKDVVLSLSSSYIYSKIIDIPLEFSSPITVDESINRRIKQMCKEWCVQRKCYLLQTINIAIQLDGNYVEDMIGLKAQKINVSVHMFFADMVLLDNLLEMFKRSYLNILDIKPKIFTIEAMIDNQDLKDLGILMLDFGGSNTTIAGIYQGKQILMETIEIGGDMLTRLIAQKLSISIEEAERLKCIYGSAMQLPQDSYEWIEVPLLSGKLLCINKVNVVEITVAYTEELLTILLKHLKKLRVPIELRKRVVLTGQASKLNKLSLAIEEILECEIIQLNSLQVEEKWLPLEGLKRLNEGEVRKNSIWRRLLDFKIFSWIKDM